MATLPFILLTVLLLTLPSSHAVTTRFNTNDLKLAMTDMRSKSYYGFVILLNMLNETIRSTEFSQRVTFLMPSDKELSELSDSSLTREDLLDFFLGHTMPEPLLFNELSHVPTETLIPSRLDGRMIRISSRGKSRVFVNNAQIVTPNVCSKSLIKCHGISAVIDYRSPRDDDSIEDTAPPVPKAGQRS